MAVLESFPVGGTITTLRYTGRSVQRLTAVEAKCDSSLLRNTFPTVWPTISNRSLPCAVVITFTILIHFLQKINMRSQARSKIICYIPIFAQGTSDTAAHRLLLNSIAAES